MRRVAAFALLHVCTAVGFGVVFALVGCGEVSSPAAFSPAGYAGATQGGIQDLTTAREMVANGVVPPSEAFPVEAMLSEHDLALDGDACDRPLCLRGALGWEDDAGWAMIGLSSSVDRAVLRRPPLAVVLLVDVSGSMGWVYGRYGLPAQVTHDLLRALVTEFDASDLVAVVTFSSQAHLVLEPIPGDRHEELVEVIERLGAESSTNMEAGLLMAGDLLRRVAAGTRDKRIILLTDAQPNVGASNPESFLGMASELAARDIALTVIGSGMGLQPEVMKAMTDLRGGNGFSVPNAASVPAFLEDNWPYMAIPIAHDLTVRAEAAAGFTVDGIYGFPGDDGQLRVASVFLSKRSGALLLSFTGGGFSSFGAALDLSYHTLGGELVQEQLVLVVPSGAALQSGRWFQAPAAAEGAALALLCDGMRRSAAQYGDNRSAAVSMLERAVQRFEGDIEVLRSGANRPDLERELDLGNDLLTLMKEGAHQGNLYGGF